MITAAFTIRFSFLADEARLNLLLEADVQEHHSDTFYIVKNIRVAGKPDNHVLPQISIRKQDDLWVHTDSGKATDLSIAAGGSIDAWTNTGT